MDKREFGINFKVNYGFILDFCGSMRGYKSMYTEEKLNQLSLTTLREIKLHWLPVAVRELVRTYHLAPLGIKSSDAIEEVRDYLVTAFKNVSTKYDLYDSDKWNTPEIVNAVYDEIFWGHPITYDRIREDNQLGEDIFKWTTHVMNCMSVRLQITIDSIIKSDKYILTEHAYSLRKPNDPDADKVRAIILKTVTENNISDFVLDPLGYKDVWDNEFTPGNDYGNLIRWNDMVRIVLKW